MSLIFEVIENVVKRLNNHPEIIVDAFIVNSPVSAEVVDREELVPDILKEFFKKSDGLKLSWHAKSDPVVRGGINIPFLKNIHRTRWKSFGLLDHTDDVHAIFQKKNGEDSRVMMESLEGDEDIEFTELGGSLLSIDDYFKAFSKTFGFRFWQENYNEDVDYSVESIIANRGYLWGED